MTYANITQAKAQLSKYLSEVKNKGTTITITKAGKPIALLSPYTKSTSVRKPGKLKGKIKTTKDFDKTPRSIIDSFYK